MLIVRTTPSSLVVLHLEWASDAGRTGKDECAAGNGYRFASTEWPIATMTVAGMGFMVTRLGPGYFAQWKPIGCLRVDPILEKVVVPRPAPDVTLVTVDYRVSLTDEWEVPLETGVTDPAYDGQVGFAHSIDFPTEVVGKVVDGRNGSRDV